MLVFAGNLLAYALQLALIVAACAALPRLLRITAPGVQYFFWRLLLGIALLLPFVQPWKRVAGVATLIGADGRAGSPWRATPVPAAAPVVFNALVLELLLAVVAAGVLLRLAWLGAGLVRLRRLRATTTEEDCAGDFDELKQTIGARAAVYWSTAVDHPVTFGWRRPLVLLPPAVRALDGAAARAVVAHELFHVRRRDWAWQLAEEAVRAVFWFHPAMWWLISRVQLARETVVDELSILATNARRAYMDTLLAFADDPPLSPASAFSRRRHLFHRIMLLSREGSMSPARLTLASLVLSAALGGSSVAAVAAFPLLQSPRDPVAGQMSPEQRTVLEQAEARARAALVREPDAPDLLNELAVTLWSRATRDPELESSARDALLREGLQLETRALAIRPEYMPALVYKNLLLRSAAPGTTNPVERAAMIAQADALRDRAAALRPSLPPPSPPMPAEFSAALGGKQPIRVGGTIKPPARVKNVPPVYPPLAESSRVQGVVIIEALIDTNGHVAAARLLRSIPLLDEAALDAVRQWEYEPTLLNGAPVPVIMTVTVNFSLP